MWSKVHSELALFSIKISLFCSKYFWLLILSKFSLYNKLANNGTKFFNCNRFKVWRSDEEFQKAATMFNVFGDVILVEKQHFGENFV